MNKTSIFALLLGTLSILSCGRKSIDEQFAENARQETQQMCPRKVDDCTMLDSVVYDIPTRTQNHYYTFSGDMDDPTLFTEHFKAEIRETMLKSLRNEIKLKKQMEAEISFGYIYYSDSTHKPIFKVLFTKEDYNGPLKQRSFGKRMTDKWIDYTQKHCPEQQDECTTLLSIDYDSLKSVLTYNFELKGELDTDSFDIHYPDAEKELRKMLRKGIKENETLKEERENDVDFHLVYKSKSTGRKLIDIKLKNKDLK